MQQTQVAALRALEMYTAPLPWIRRKYAAHPSVNAPCRLFLARSISSKYRVDFAIYLSMCGTGI